MIGLKINCSNWLHVTMNRIIKIFFTVLIFVFFAVDCDAYIDDLYDLIVDEGETVYLSGHHTYRDTVEIRGTVIISVAEEKLELETSSIFIGPMGSINGDGKGYMGGPGGGGYPGPYGPFTYCDCGRVSGGCGYGGYGGNGCCCFTDGVAAFFNPGGGGRTYGTSWFPTIDMGSCGGGGAIILRASGDFILQGSLTVNGVTPRSSGGGVLIIANDVIIMGNISANGVDGNSVYEGRDGGGGGGRIKIFYKNSYSKLGGGYAVSGGSGGYLRLGCYGDSATEGTITIMDLDDIWPPTYTPTPTPTGTWYSPTPTLTPTSTLTSTNTFSPTITFTPTLTGTPTPTPTPGGEGTLKWAVIIGRIGSSSPALGYDGTIYIGSIDHKLYAIDPRGFIKWEFETFGQIDRGSPAVASDGTIYIGSRDGNLYAINPDGSEKWHFTISSGLSGSAAIGKDGTIYFGTGFSGFPSSYGCLYALNPDGTEKWRFESDCDFESPASIGRDGTIYVNCVDKLFSFNPDGTKNWEFYASYMHTNPAISSDGTIFITTYVNKCYSLFPDGSENWNKSIYRVYSSSPAITKDGTIYFGSLASSAYRIFYALNSDGSLKWEYHFLHNIYSSPLIGADGVIYIGVYNSVWALNPDGMLRWGYDCGISYLQSPVLAPDGTLYICADDGKLFAIYTSSPGLSNSPWPMLSHDAQHTGRYADSVYPLIPTVNKIALLVAIFLFVVGSTICLYIFKFAERAK
ncbi:MAG: hypothetical protein A2161_05110 [Candidatus Schekmanbacteria bacterium RBG_13_48_7]|uniref:Pyrrolo-quinoline quinone repeat domain-containing protein n=1 Tax=Candidatus Schekmanbacteria bacterium RBG_13_48_7 TaxID=1817878 RepID=A0A1F7S1R8_9BACT|nr:MAG: hypothetical protein A2161_05110 [Candidatus Schekmanbacteria bacterium RBG_13_48_7]